MSPSVVRYVFVIVGAMLALNQGQVGATIYTVINTRDSGPGSLAQAFWDSEGHAGRDSIYFNIPTSDSAYVPGPPSRWIIRPSGSPQALFDAVLIDGYTQPGSQVNTVASPGATNAVLKIVLGGVNAGSGAKGLHLLGSATVRGLVINNWSDAGFYLVGGPSTIQGNYIGTNVDGVTAYGNGIGIDILTGTHTIGGTTPAARNVVSGNTTGGIRIGGASGLTSTATVRGNYIGTQANGSAALPNGSGAGYGVSVDYGQSHVIGGTTDAARNIISGNGGDGIYITHHSTGPVILGNYVGTNAAGTSGLGNGRHGIYVAGPTGSLGSTALIVGGTTASARNILSGNGADGVFVSWIQSTTVVGNYIGTDVSGTVVMPNGWEGIRVYVSDSTAIGGATTGAGNLISGNAWSGIRLVSSSYSVVQGNRIGTDAGGTADLGNGGHGLYVNGSHTEIGGTDAGEANTIAFNDSCGVGIFWSYYNPILCNSIHSNGRLGIDLAKGGDPPSGVTYNDYQDTDFDSNFLQNFPVLTSVASTAGNILVNGTLNSSPSTTFRLEFFGGTSPDPTGYGEGDVFLGWTSVTTNTSGDASFSVSFPAPTRATVYVSATATDPTLNTSEFSQVRYYDVALAGDLNAGQLALVWTPVPGASQYWVYGASNDVYFDPQIVLPYGYRVTVLPSGTTTWSTTTGVGDVNNNWTYLIIAVDGAGQELVRTNRIGEHDYTLP